MSGCVTKGMCLAQNQGTAVTAEWLELEIEGQKSGAICRFYSSETAFVDTPGCNWIMTKVKDHPLGVLLLAGGVLVGVVGLAVHQTHKNL